jgi:hypothetical protein
MADKQKWMNMFLPFIAGFCGGIISILIFNPDTLFAKKQAETPMVAKAAATPAASKAAVTTKASKAAAIPKVLTAEEFRLVDKYGKTRAILKSSYTRDALRADKENQDVQLQLIGEKGDIQLSAGEFTSAIEMSQNDYSKEEKLHSSILLSTTGASSNLRLNYDQPVSKDTDPNEVQQPSSGDMKMELSVNSYSKTSNIRLFDDNNNERVNIGNAYVIKKDGTGANFPASSIHLYRNDGKVSWYERE